MTNLLHHIIMCLCFIVYHKCTSPYFHSYCTSNYYIRWKITCSWGHWAEERKEKLSLLFSLSTGVEQEEGFQAYYWILLPSTLSECSQYNADKMAMPIFPTNRLFMSLSFKVKNLSPRRSLTLLKMLIFPKTLLKSKRKKDNSRNWTMLNPMVWLWPQDKQ